MKTWGEQPKIHFDEKELKTDLGKGNTIFVGNTNDMFADNIPGEWIEKTLSHCNNYDNQYVFQSKNPFRMGSFTLQMPERTMIGTTIETNRDTRGFSKAPLPIFRARCLKHFTDQKTFITIEPIMDFDVEPFVELIISAKPSFVNIGADSKKHNLPEPRYIKVLNLIDLLKKNNIEIRKKVNLERLKCN
jgi:hypothetical protein